MNLALNKIKNSVLIILAVAFLLTAYLLKQANQEKNRLNDNQTTLLTDVKFYKTKDSLSAAGVDRLTLKNSEFEKYNAGLVKEVENLNLKVRRLESASQTGIKTEYKIKTVVKDSLVYRDGKPQSVQCINQHDKWMSLDGCIINKFFEGNVMSIDSIDQFVHRVPRKFLFIKYGTKAIRQEVVSKNPNSTIYYSKYIELKR